MASDPLTGTGCGLYFNRARWYEPTTGRFLQADLNETALPLLAALVTSGESAAALALSMFSAAGHYADGLNLHGYLGSNPVNRFDPSGLETYDDLLASAGFGSELYQNALLGAGLASAFVFGILGPQLTEGFGVLGAVTAGGLETVLAATEAFVSRRFGEAEALWATAEIAVFATATSEAVKHAKGYARNIARHMGWILSGKGGTPPNPQDVDKWKQDVARALHEIEKWLPEMNRPTRGIWQRYVNSVREWLRSGGPPPLAPG